MSDEYLFSYLNIVHDYFTFDKDRVKAIVNLSKFILKINRGEIRTGILVGVDI